ncbi:MAG: hydroxysqualene dehydroxylase HpnE [Phycisphaerales bacterium]
MMRTAAPAGSKRRAKRVIIAGGGLAGIAAAIALSARGVACTLLETRKRLGGRATSFDDPRTGETLDNCQHVALGCCTSYFWLCRQLGVQHMLQRHPGIWWREPGGRTSVMKPAPLPAPAHFAPALLAAKFLDPEDKATIAAAMALAIRADRNEFNDRTFDQWLDEAGVTPLAQTRFFEPLIVSACNGTPARISAGVALHVVQEGLLAHREAGAMWVSRVPLAHLYDPAEPIIASTGGQVRLGASIAELHHDHAVLADGQRFHADRVISALPAERLSKVAAPSLRATDPRIAAADTIEHAPIVGVHLRFDRAVMDSPNCVLVDCPTQWLFRKDNDGTRIHAVISDARAWVALDEGEIVERVLGDIRACTPESRGAQLEWARAVKEKRATFVASPTFERTRPDGPPPDPHHGLILAGDWTNTGWPATMEGAVRSGLIAAGAVLAEHPPIAPHPPLRPGVALRLLAGPSLRAQARASAPPTPTRAHNA